jgi:hypothetical protein
VDWIIVSLVFLIYYPLSDCLLDFEALISSPLQCLPVGGIPRGQRFSSKKEVVVQVSKILDFSLSLHTDYTVHKGAVLLFLPPLV